jgi:hypothetical protein
MEKERVEEWHPDLHMSSDVKAPSTALTDIFPEIEVSIGGLCAQVFEIQRPILAHTIVA